jgi:hypothetical protein
MTLGECEEIAQALRGRAKMDAQFGQPPSETLSGKAAEAIAWLLGELADAEGWGDDFYMDDTP